MYKIENDSLAEGAAFQLNDIVLGVSGILVIGHL